MLESSLNERSRRVWAAAEAQALGYGGASLVSRATGISRSTIMRGRKETRARRGAPAGRIRRPGGGRKSATRLDPRLKTALEALVDPVSRGDPESPLRWTCKSTRLLARELSAAAHHASDWLVRQLLYDLGYSLQANRKTKEGARHPDRDASFGTSTPQWRDSFGAGTRRFPSTRRRRSWSGTSRTAAENGGLVARPTPCACTTSSIRRRARPSRTACMTSPSTRAG